MKQDNPLINIICYNCGKYFKIAENLVEIFKKNNCPLCGKNLVKKSTGYCKTCNGTGQVFDYSIKGSGYEGDFIGVGTYKTCSNCKGNGK